MSEKIYSIEIDNGEEYDANYKFTVNKTFTSIEDVKHYLDHHGYLIQSSSGKNEYNHIHSYYSATVREISVYNPEEEVKMKEATDFYLLPIKEIKETGKYYGRNIQIGGVSDGIIFEEAVLHSIRDKKIIEKLEEDWLVFKKFAEVVEEWKEDGIEMCIQFEHQYMGYNQNESKWWTAISLTKGSFIGSEEQIECALFTEYDDEKIEEVVAEAIKKIKIEVRKQEKDLKEQDIQ